MIDLLTNAEEYWRSKSQYQAQQIDSLQKTVTMMQKSFELNSQAFTDLSKAFTDVVTLTETASKAQETAALTEMKGKRNLWRGLTIITVVLFTIEKLL